MNAIYAENNDNRTNEAYRNLTADDFRSKTTIGLFLLKMYSAWQAASAMYRIETLKHSAGDFKSIFIKKYGIFEGMSVHA